MKDTQDAIERQVLTDQRKKVLALKDDFKETDNFDDKKAEVEEILKRLNVIINGKLLTIASNSSLGYPSFKRLQPLVISA